MVKVSGISKGVVRAVEADQRFFKGITAGHFKESAFSLHVGNNIRSDFHILMFDFAYRDDMICPFIQKIDLKSFIIFFKIRRSKQKESWFSS